MLLLRGERNAQSDGLSQLVLSLTQSSYVYSSNSAYKYLCFSKSNARSVVLEFQIHFPGASADVPEMRCVDYHHKFIWAFTFPLCSSKSEYQQLSPQTHRSWRVSVNLSFLTNLCACDIKALALLLFWPFDSMTGQILPLWVSLPLLSARLFIHMLVSCGESQCSCLTVYGVWVCVSGCFLFSLCLCFTGIKTHRVSA